MTDLNKQIIKDILFFVASIIVAIFFIKSGIAHQFISALDGYNWLGIIFAGLFFTSIFTSAPSIVLLGVFTETTPLYLIALLGGLGAVLGDFIIFYFVRDRISKDLSQLLAVSPGLRVPLIFKKELFKFLLPFLGAFIIASPLPDELGVVMLGISNISKKRFILLTFVLNSIGIFIVAWMAKLILGF
ncbi:hypothetical protein KKH36_03490 [Patescibacteria group bacterium]|nr:hypothetical protein [Patescibacteria group bacterium]